ncbi:NUDIX domain-containing protein [Nocardioides sp. Kera G14]|uniref:NUDIX domain-containing protein n=1 Tax=Nocardioides sp. Kera G14 TaxID=2884264 RepID=UPI001D11703E|nr:NUDIX hydrolase [Nocardioides sp. Kera G14]UDY25267.1 NUDIX hydrolase [Nocardioides sp. Kera G14]
MVSDRDESWPVLGTTTIHKDDWVVGVRKDEITRPEGGDPFERLIVTHPGAAMVLAVDDEHRVLVISQYRHAVGKRMIQLPAGVIDHEGEDPLDTAKRELQEEAEYAAERWDHLVSYNTSPGLTDERFHIYLARGLSPAPRGDFEMLHEEADLTTEWVQFTELLDDVVSGRVNDGALITGVLAYNVMSRRGVV